MEPTISPSTEVCHSFDDRAKSFFLFVSSLFVCAEPDYVADNGESKPTERSTAEMCNILTALPHE